METEAQIAVSVTKPIIVLNERKLFIFGGCVWEKLKQYD